MMVKIAISYRVAQHWRVPTFDALDSEFDLRVFCTEGFSNSKVKSAKDSRTYITILRALKFKYVNNKGTAYVVFPFGLFRSLVRFNPDVILSEGASNIFGAAISFLYAKLFRKKFIWWTLGTLNDGAKQSTLRRLLNPIISYIEVRSDRILLYSEQGREFYLNRGFNSEKLIVATNTVDTRPHLSYLSKFGQTTKDYNDVFNIGFLGALVENKGLPFLLTLAEELRNEPFFFNVAGSGSCKDWFNREIISRQLKNIDVVGGVYGEEKFDFFLNQDIIIMPGLGGLVISEAVAMDTLFLSGNGDGSEKDYARSECGIVMTSHERLAWANELRKLAGDKNYLEERRMALKRNKHKFSFDNYMRKITQMIQEVCDD